MKIKLTKNQMRYIDKEEWWKIKFPNKKKNIEGGIEHRCAVKQSGWWQESANMEWVPCTKGPHATDIPTCANCEKKPPEELQADAIMLGIKARKRDWQDEFRKMTKEQLPIQPMKEGPLSPWVTPMPHPGGIAPYRQGVGTGTAPNDITWEQWSSANDNDITIQSTSKTYVDNVTYYENALDIVKGKLTCESTEKK